MEITKDVKLTLSTECRLSEDDIVRDVGQGYSAYMEYVNFNEVILGQGLPSGDYKVTITLEKLNK